MGGVYSNRPFCRHSPNLNKRHFSFYAKLYYTIIVTRAWKGIVWKQAMEDVPYSWFRTIYMTAYVYVNRTVVHNNLNSFISSIRKMAGLTLHRCRQTIRKKVQFFTRHSKMELTEKYISMRGILNDRLVAERETVFEEPSSREIEFFQNQSFALTNVTSDFLLFFKKLSERLFNLLRANKHSKTVISSAKSQLAEDTQLMTDFTERFIRSDSEQNIMKGNVLCCATCSKDSTDKLKFMVWP